MMRFKSYT